MVNDIVDTQAWRPGIELFAIFWWSGYAQVLADVSEGDIRDDVDLESFKLTYDEVYQLDNDRTPTSNGNNLPIRPFVRLKTFGTDDPNQRNHV